MRIGQSRSKEELKVQIVSDRFVTKLDDPARARFNLLLQQNRLKCGIEVLTDVLEEAPAAELNADF